MSIPNHFKNPVFWILYVVMLPVLALLSALRPLIHIRVCALHAQRIGHFAMNNEMYLCEKDAGLIPGRYCDIFFHDTPVSNLQLKKMWEKRLTVSRGAYFVHKAAAFFPWFKQHIFVTQSRDIHGIFDQCQPHLSFSEAEKLAGNKALENFGINDDRFVCVLCRDPRYLEHHHPVMDWSYHDFRDVDIDTYIPALETLGDSGLTVLRMGVVVSKPLRSNHPKLIDYASNGARSDFLDIYLASKCRFFISNGTGLDAVAKAFHRPVLYTNYIPLAYAHFECAHDLLLFKRIWSRAEQRFLTFREIIESGVGDFLDGHLYEKHQLEIIDNTPEELTAAVSEMAARRDGTWVVTKEDRKLQDRFRALFSGNPKNGVLLANASTHFLRNNQALLE